MTSAGLTIVQLVHSCLASHKEGHTKIITIIHQFNRFEDFVRLPSLLSFSCHLLLLLPPAATVHRSERKFAFTERKEAMVFNPLDWHLYIAQMRQKDISLVSRMDWHSSQWSTFLRAWYTFGPTFLRAWFTFGLAFLRAWYNFGPTFLRDWSNKSSTSTRPMSLDPSNVYSYHQPPMVLFSPSACVTSFLCTSL